jgi:hypothetical protein
MSRMPGFQGGASSPWLKAGFPACGAGVARKIEDFVGFISKSAGQLKEKELCQEDEWTDVYSNPVGQTVIP